MSITRRFLTLFAAAGILAVVGAACSASPPTFEEEFGGVTGIVLNNGNGSVSVVGASRDTVLVSGEANPIGGFSNATTSSTKCKGIQYCTNGSPRPAIRNDRSCSTVSA